MEVPERKSGLSGRILLVVGFLSENRCKEFGAVVRESPIQTGKWILNRQETLAGH